MKIRKGRAWVFKRYPNKPANFVLFRNRVTRDYFAVVKRTRPKYEYRGLGHFMGFFASEADAYREAIKLTRFSVEQLESWIKDYRKKIKKVPRPTRAPR